MNTQPTRAPQDPTTWKRRWYRLRYRFLRRIARLLRMPRPLDMNQALKNQRWEGFQEARDHYLGHCPYHPEELTLETGWGFRKCCLCWNEDYFKTLDSGPITDPHQTQIRNLHFPGRPLASFNQAIQHGAGPHTAITSAVSRMKSLKKKPD